MIFVLLSVQISSLKTIIFRCVYKYITYILSLQNNKVPIINSRLFVLSKKKTVFFGEKNEVKGNTLFTFYNNYKSTYTQTLYNTYLIFGILIKARDAIQLYVNTCKQGVLTLRYKSINIIFLKLLQISHTMSYIRIIFIFLIQCFLQRQMILNI